MKKPKALELLAGGATVSSVARNLGVSRATVRYWREGGGERGAAREVCPTTGCPWLPSPPTEETYAYLLGMYLGDGCISPARATKRLRIFLDDKYPGIQEECLSAVLAVRGKVGARVARRGCTEISSYWNHWPCVFPQHGPGRKHERPIALQPWQECIVSTHPQMLLRGMVHSDGCRDRNVVKGREYPRYSFKNASADIHDVFQSALTCLGIHYTIAWRVTQVARRSDVATMDGFIGPKF